MEIKKKESYSEPVLIVHELLRDITAQQSGAKNQREKSGNESPV
jgi:hypothetical protein